MPFLTFKAQIISAQQIEQSWCLETYKLFAPAQKQLAHPLFSSYSVVSRAWIKAEMAFSAPEAQWVYILNERAQDTDAEFRFNSSKPNAWSM